MSTTDITIRCRRDECTWSIRRLNVAKGEEVCVKAQTIEEHELLAHTE